MRGEAAQHSTAQRSIAPDLDRLVRRSKESTPSGLGYSISLCMRAGCVRCESGVLLLRVQGSLPLVMKLQPRGGEDRIRCVIKDAFYKLRVQQSRSSDSRLAPGH